MCGLRPSAAAMVRLVAPSTTWAMMSASRVERVLGGGLGKVAAAPGQQFDHRLAGDPQLAVENGLDTFGKVLQGSVAVKKAPDAFKEQLRFKAGKGVEVEQADPARAGIFGNPGGAGRQAAVDRRTHAVEQQKKLLGAKRRQRGRLRAVVAQGKTADRGLFFQKRGHEIVLQRIGADDNHRLAQISALLLVWLLVTVQQHRLDRWDGSVAVCPEPVRRWSVLLWVLMSLP